MKKPMLLSNDEFDIENLDYTSLFQSKKRDGVRAETTNEGIKGRSLKILRNKNIQNWFKEVYENLPNDVILEAEIYSDSLPCREIAGICNSLDKEVPNDLKLYIFGMYNSDFNFEKRMVALNEIKEKYLKSDRFEIVEQIKVDSVNMVQELYNQFIDEGFEGAVLMDGRKFYKEGRVTIRQHIGFKLKPHKEMDLPIIDATERFLNTNESKTNELGHSFKRNTVDAKEETGIAATFICKLPNGMETKVTITGDEEYRREIWENKEKYIGQYAVVKSMAYGEKDKLRHPRLMSIKYGIEK